MSKIWKKCQRLSFSHWYSCISICGSERECAGVSEILIGKRQKLKCYSNDRSFHFTSSKAVLKTDCKCKGVVMKSVVRWKRKFVQNHLWKRFALSYPGFLRYLYQYFGFCHFPADFRTHSCTCACAIPHLCAHPSAHANTPAHSHMCQMHAYRWETDKSQNFL